MVTYTYDADENIIRTVIAGKVNRQLVFDYLDRLENDPVITPGAVERVEVMEDTEFEVDGADFQSMTLRFEQTLKKLKLSRSEYIAHSDLGYGLGRMLQNVMETIPHDVTVTRA